MDYATLKREAAKYPDTMTSMERMKAYAMGEVVDHIPFSTGGPDSFVHLYGYTLGEYRRSMDVQFDVAEQAKREFGGSGMYANTNLSLRGVGEAVGSKVVYPENSTDYISEHVLKN